MKDQEIIASLRECGLTEREIKLYLAMLEKSEATAPELHRISGVLRTKTYETLEHMVAKGYCTDRLEGKRRYFRAVRPAQLEEVLKHQWNTELRTKEDAAKPVLTLLEDRFQTAPDVDRSLDFVEVIRSQDQIQRRFIEISGEANDEVLSFNRSPYVSANPALLKEQEKVVKKQLEKGVKARILYMDEEDHWSWLRKHVEAMQKAGEKVRLTDDLPVKMVIVDQRKVLMALPYSVQKNHQVNFTALIVEDPGFTKACVILFELFWGKAMGPDEWLAKRAES